MGGGTPAGKRILAAAGVGAAVGLAYGAVNRALAIFVMPDPDAPTTILKILWAFVAAALWRVLLFTLIAALGAFAAEARIPAPRPRPAGA